MQQQSLTDFFKVSRGDSKTYTNRSSHKTSLFRPHNVSWKSFLYNVDIFPLSAKQRHPQNNDCILSDTQIRTLDGNVAICALTYKYVLVSSQSYTKETCKQISELIEKFYTYTLNTPGEIHIAVDAYSFLVQHFGTQPKTILKIVSQLFSTSAFEERLSFSNTPTLYSKTIKQHLIQNPYLLVQWFGIDFETINKVAFEHGWWQQCSYKQIQTFLHHRLQHSNDTCMFWKNGRGIMHAKRELLMNEDESMHLKFDTQLQKCYDAYLDEASHTKTATQSISTLHNTFYTTPELYDVEHKICKMNHLFGTTECPYEDCFQSSNAIKNTHNIPLDTTQLSTIKSFVSPENNCMILQGGAGTGKTQVGVCAVLEYNIGYGIPVTWCAPTHEATLNAKRRLQSFCKTSTVCFSTLHSFLGKMDVLRKKICTSLKEPTPTAIYNTWQDNKTDEDMTPRILVIDECSMLSSALLAQVVQHIHSFRIQKVLLLGDRHQLEPVDAGKPFADLQDMYAKYPNQRHLPKVITLKKNYRSEGLGIIELSRNVIDNDYIWTFEHDVQDNPDVTFHTTHSDEQTMNVLSRVLETLQKHSVKPETFLRMYPEVSQSFHIITPNNMHILHYANLVRSIYYDQDIPHDTLSPNDIVRFDTNREFYHNGTLGKVLYVKKDKHILIVLQHEEAQLTDILTKGVLQCVQNETFLKALYNENKIKTPFTLWKDEYVNNAQNIHHPQFYKIALQAYNYCCNHMKQQSYSSNRDKTIESIYWKSIDLKKNDVFLVCKHIMCIPYKHQECKLSYASTIHKAQGGEADYVICVMPPSMRYSVNRNLAYTAFSRARKHLYLIGLASSFQKCNSNASKRITLLPHMIREQQSS